MGHYEAILGPKIGFQSCPELAQHMGWYDPIWLIGAENWSAEQLIGRSICIGGLDLFSLKNLGPNFSLVTKNPPFLRHHRVVRLINYGELPSKVWLTRDQWPHCCLIQSTPPSSLKRSILKRTQRQQRTHRERTQHFLLFITLNITIFK